MPTKKKPALKRRGNPIANNALMRKGGAHIKTRSSKRQKQKNETRHLVSKYYSGYSIKSRNRQSTGKTRGGAILLTYGRFFQLFSGTPLYTHHPLHQMKSAF